MIPYKVGDRVRRRNSDYRFDGVVVAAFSKLSGAVRYVVEDDRGILFVQSESSIEPVVDEPDACFPHPDVGGTR